MRIHNLIVMAFPKKNSFFFEDFLSGPNAPPLKNANCVSIVASPSLRKGPPLSTVTKLQGHKHADAKEAKKSTQNASLGPSRAQKLTEMMLLLFCHRTWRLCESFCSTNEATTRRILPNVSPRLSLYRANGRGGLGRKLLLTPLVTPRRQSRPWVL